jgi:predicted TIM-barrel fold metal-dependent hydrolase
MRYQGPIVDVDVHHRWKNDAEIVAYLPKKWGDYVRDAKGSVPLTPPWVTMGVFLSGGGRRMDSFPPDGGKPGSDYETMKEQLLDHYNYFKAVLTYDVGEQAAFPNQQFARALCSAVNDWNIDTWLSNGDDRLRSLVVVPSATPEAAADEIRRVGNHPSMVGILLPVNPLGRPFGDPVYHPIYKAAAELGLMVAIHPSPGDNHGVKFVGGPANTGIEYINQFGAQAMHYISSYIVQGVFEQFPDLKITIKEFGVSWLPTLMWRLDQNYDLLRRESPWVKKLPSEYIREHIKLSTQPIEVGKDPGAWVELMSTIEGVEDMLCFSTDYPHYSYDDPAYIARILPESWHRKVFCENACRLYGWQAPEGVFRAAEAVR